MQRRHVVTPAVTAVLLLVCVTHAATRAELPSISQPDLSGSISSPVLRVVDGDTIVAMIGGKETTIRLIGVDTPETVHPSKPVEFYGKEASLFAANLLKGESIFVVTDPQQGLTDRYGRTLAYVYRAPDGLFVNAEIVRQGYGHAYTNYPFLYMEEFRQLESFARQGEKGLWAPSAQTRQEAGASTRLDAVPTTTRGNAKESNGDIIVYVTKTGTKYHQEGCKSLAKSSIPMSLKEAEKRYAPCSICNPPRSQGSDR